MFSKNEIRRYARHFALENFGEEAQRRLKSSKVLVIGAGGLGSPVIQYLAAAGVGTIGIIDQDTVDLSNLQRQVLYTENDIGKKKVDVAETKIKELNNHITVRKYPEKLTNNNALRLISFYDFVVDGSDNFPTRYLVNDACVILHKPYVFGSVYKFEGQVSVFNYNNGPTYRCIFPSPPTNVPNCAEAGVLGALTGIIGSIQATEVLKLITGIGKVLSGKLLIINSLSFIFDTFKIPKNKKINIKELEKDYLDFCNSPLPLNGITVENLKELIDSEKQIQLIDIRTPKERKFGRIKSENHELQELLNNPHIIKNDRPVILFCQTGKRTLLAIQELKKKFAFKNIQYLIGGIDKWN